MNREARQAETVWTNGTHLLLAIVVFLLFASRAVSQPPATVTIQGKVLDDAGAPIANAQVFLVHDGSRMAETFTKAGAFTFGGLQPGEYIVSAQSAERKSAPVTVNAPQAGWQEVRLTIAAPDSAPQDAAPGMEFADKPNFTVAAVTDWTAAGGHGSDAVLRTSESLNRETLNLNPGASSARPELSTAEWKQKETALRAAVANAPHRFETNHELGEFYLQSEKYSDSVPALAAAYKIDPGNFDNEYDLALALKGSGEFAQAQAHVQNLLARRDSADVHRLAGQIEESRGDPLAAVHQFERAVRLDPSEQNYFEWGSELLLHRAVWQAKDVFSAAVKAWPKSQRLLTALGAALFAGAMYDDAAQRLCEASDLNPADPEPYRFLGKVEISSPDPLPCVEQKLARFAAQRPDDPLANYFYAMTIWKQNGPAPDPPTLDRVQSLLLHAVKSDPKCSDAYFQLGVLQVSRRDYRKAIEFYAKAIEANPQLSEAHYRLGVAYDRMGDKQKAAEQFRLHDEIEKQQAAAIEKQRREVKQFVVVVNGQKQDAKPD